MPLKIAKIEKNEHFEFKGDVEVTGDVGNNATIIIKDGNLLIHGNVDDDSKIKLLTENQNIIINSGSVFFGSSGTSNSFSLSVLGNIGKNINISSHNADPFHTR